MAYFTTKDNCNIYYEEHGSGEPLIFIHGWSCNHKFFKYQIDEFAKITVSSSMISGDMASPTVPKSQSAA